MSTGLNPATRVWALEMKSIVPLMPRSLMLGSDVLFFRAAGRRQQHQEGIVARLQRVIVAGIA